MTTTVCRAITIKRPHREVAAFVTDPTQVLAAIPGFARFTHLGPASQEEPGSGPDGDLWDVFLDVGTLHVGGRVVVRKPSINSLEWHSLRGTKQNFSMTVEPIGGHSRLTMTLTYALSGLLMAKASEVLARGIVTRHLDAGLEQVRHLLEYGDAIELA